METSSYLGAETSTPFKPSGDERTMAILAHILTLFSAILAPLIIYLIKKEDSPYVADHAKESLNFQITMAIICIGLGITIIGIFLIPFVLIFVVICVLIGTIQASDNKLFRYPLTWRLVK